MVHPIVMLQAGLVAALRDDEGLVNVGILDAPAEGASPPYVVIVRHDLLSRDGDAAPGHEHRVLLHIWAGEASRRAVLAIAERVLAVAMTAPLGESLLVTHRRHERTDTIIDAKTGLARAALALSFFSEI